MTDENRVELMQRLELMETMVAEGRKITERAGWIFVLWGVAYFAAVGWEIFLPAKNFAWPVCIAAAIVILNVGKARQKAKSGSGESPRSRSIESVWRGVGIAITLYVIGAVVSHHITQPACTAAILFFVGLAHAISAMILRWKAQGVAAAIWWIGGSATFFTGPRAGVVIFLAAAFFGMIVFGLYAMMLERKREISGSVVASS